MELKALEKLAESLNMLPSIGPKIAHRLALYILKMPEKDVEKLINAIKDARQKIKHCSICGGLTENDPCWICENPSRNKKIICVVQQPSDIEVIEKTGLFRGVYHVLGGALSPLDGVGPQDLRIKELIDRINSGQVEEVILATNPNSEGEITTEYIALQLKPLGVKISCLARGLPVGGDLEYADEVTLARAIEGRKEL